MCGKAHDACHQGKANPKETQTGIAMGMGTTRAMGNVVALDVVVTVVILVLVVVA